MTEPWGTWETYLSSAYWIVDAGPKRQCPKSGSISSTVYAPNPGACLVPLVDPSPHSMAHQGKDTDDAEPP